MSRLQTFLIVLLGIQVTLTLGLLVKLSSFETNRATDANPVSPPPASVKVATIPAESRPLADDTRLSEYQLRRIIRDEISRLMPADSGAETDPVSNEPVLDPAEIQYQRNLVIQELEALKGQAEASTAELDRLLGDIARLDPQSRNELLAMLNRAMNRGEIRGNL